MSININQKIRISGEPNISDYFLIKIDDQARLAGFRISRKRTLYFNITYNNPNITNGTYVAYYANSINLYIYDTFSGILIGTVIIEGIFETTTS